MRRVLRVFGYTDDGDIDWIKRAGRRLDAPSGAPLIEAGVTPDELFIVLEGELSVLSADAVELGRRLPGEIVGELSFLDGGAAEESVIAATDAVLVAIDHAALNRRLALDPPSAARFYRSLALLVASRMREAMAQLRTRDGGPGADEDDDALDEDLLDHLALAGARFELLLDHFLRT